MDSLFLPKIELPSHNELFQAAEKFSNVLETENIGYRPKNIKSNAGSLLDFSKDTIPVIVVPDLHARPYFIQHILEYKIKPEIDFLDTENDETVFSALEKGLLRVVCVGDALHTESSTAIRWALAYNDFRSGNLTGDAMKDEMTEGLSLLLQLMNLKVLFPEHFHFLKGNHENIRNATENGDYGFKKYAEEGLMVKCFMTEHYGEDILYLLSFCESLLPLVYLAPNCIVSHAEPFRAYTRDEIINARLLEGVVEGLTWTANGDARNGSVRAMIDSLLPETQSQNAVYIAGHRPVDGTYKLRQGGDFIQIHNPKRQNVALVRLDRRFDPEKDIVSVVADDNIMEKDLGSGKWAMNFLR